MPEPSLRAMQLGLIAFTPEDLQNDLADPNDRPYASLLFVSNSRTYVVDHAGPVYDTSVAFGILGLDAAKGCSEPCIEATGSKRSRAGWDHQISDGGEPTFRVTMARQALLAVVSRSQPDACRPQMAGRRQRRLPDRGQRRIVGAMGHHRHAVVEHEPRTRRLHDAAGADRRRAAGGVAQGTLCMGRREAACPATTHFCRASSGTATSSTGPTSSRRSSARPGWA